MVHFLYLIFSRGEYYFCIGLFDFLEYYKRLVPLWMPRLSTVKAGAFLIRKYAIVCKLSIQGGAKPFMILNCQSKKNVR